MATPADDTNNNMITPTEEANDATDPITSEEDTGNSLDSSSMLKGIVTLLLRNFFRLVNPKEGLFSILLNHCRLVKKLNYCVPK
jgi:hypothetical protein